MPESQDVAVRLKTIKAKLLEKPGKTLSENLGLEFPKAAVCLILRPSPKENEIYILLVKRRIYASDPWSGQIALPGGKLVETDADLLATVIREVMEETGIDLRNLSMIGSLDEILPGNRSIRVMPYVAFSPESLEVKIDQMEIQEFLWVPISYFEDRKNLTPYSVQLRGAMMTVSGYTYLDKGTIWGMTLRIIDDFLSKISTSA